MMKLFFRSRSFTVLLITIGSLPVAQSAASVKSRNKQILSANLFWKGTIQDLYFCNGKSKRWLLSLYEDKDINNNVVILTLYLSKNGKDRNIFDKEQKNGIAPFSFAASDLAKSPEKTIYGRSRRIILSDGGGAADVSLESANVQNSISSIDGYAIKSLRLAVNFTSGSISKAHPC